MPEEKHSVPEEKIILYASDLQVVAASFEDPPFDVQAMVFEQDTFLIMDDPYQEKYLGESREALRYEMSDTLPAPPGGVVVRGEKPRFRFLAIVYDVSEEPSWNEEWVAKALDGIFRESEQRGIRFLGLPPLGILHGDGLSKERFFVLLGAALKRASISSLKRLWIIT